MAFYDWAGMLAKLYQADHQMVWAIIDIPNNCAF